MAKIFELDARKGTFIDSVSKTTMTPTNVTFKRTEKGQSLFFSKKNATEQINTNRTLIPETGDFSIEAYINLSNVIQTGDLNFDSYPIISQGGDSFSFYAATWYGGASGKLRLYAKSQILVGTDVRGKGWKHIILTRNSNNWDLFVDNELNKSAIFSDSIPSADTLIGFSTKVNRRFKGFINKVAIYNHSLSEKERNQLYQEFLQSQPTEKPVRGFELIKPTDLSYQKDRGLLAAYNFKRNGNTLVDISGNGYNGTINGAVIQSKEGLFTTDTTSNVLISAGPIITTNTYSVLGRIKINNLMNDDGVLFSNGNTTTNEIIDSIGIRSGKLSWNYDSSGTYKAGATTDLPLNSYVDFAFVSDGGRSGVIKLYINGVEDTITSTVFYRSGTGSRLFARSSGTGFLGDCADFRIYNRVLSEQEIKDYHNSFIKPVILEDWSGSAVSDVI